MTPVSGSGGLRLTLTDRPVAKAEGDIRAALWAFNETATGEGPHRPLAVLVEDGGGRVVGGLVGRTSRGWLVVDMLFLPDALRRGGLGRRLLAEAEAEAVRRGCRNVRLETSSYQAPGFYRRLGYEVFGELDDYPGEHRRFFLRKRLDGDAPVSHAGGAPGPRG